MKKRALLLLVFVMTMLSSCMRAGSFHELTLCGAYAVPGMFYPDLKGNTTSVNTLETDTQGRILFEFTAPNTITGERETALVICQYIDADYVYYYEDQCYLFHGYSEADIALLKTQNDWGLPQSRGKMSVRANNISFDLYINTDSVLSSQETDSAICKGLSALDASLEESHLLDVNPRGYALYWVKATANQSDVNYYAIIRPDRETAFLSALDESIDPSVIATFKQENGWFCDDSYT